MQSLSVVLEKFLKKVHDERIDAVNFNEQDCIDVCFFTVEAKCK